MKIPLQIINLPRPIAKAGGCACLMNLEGKDLKKKCCKNYKKGKACKRCPKHKRQSIL